MPALIRVGTRILLGHRTILPRVGPLQEAGISDKSNSTAEGVVLQVVIDTDLRSKIGSMARTEVGIPLLDRAILRPSMGLTNAVAFGDAPDLQIAGPDGPDLALLDQAAERLHGFFKGCCGIVAMGVIQIDSVCLQPAEALFALAFDLS